MAFFVATVNADLPVGALQETVTVTGESPIVDVQSARRQRTLDSELIQALPTVRSYAGLVRMIPSMIGGGNNVVLQPTMIVFGDSDMFRPEHVVEFYKLLGGGQRDAGWQRDCLLSSLGTPTQACAAAGRTRVRVACGVPERV